MIKVVMTAQGEVVVREADEPEGWVDADDACLGDLLSQRLAA